MPDDDEAWDRLGGGHPDASESVFDIVSIRGRVQGVHIRGVDYPAPDRITQTTWLNYWQARTAAGLEDCDRATSFNHGILTGIVTGVVVSVFTTAAANAVPKADHHLAVVTYLVLLALLVVVVLYCTLKNRDISKERGQLERVRLAYTKPCTKHRPVGGQ